MPLRMMHAWTSQAATISRCFPAPSFYHRIGCMYMRMEAAQAWKETLGVNCPFMHTRKQVIGSAHAVLACNLCALSCALSLPSPWPDA